MLFRRLGDLFAVLIDLFVGAGEPEGPQEADGLLLSCAVPTYGHTRTILRPFAHVAQRTVALPSGGRGRRFDPGRGHMHINRRGATRTVLLIGRWAVKVPSLRGVGAAVGQVGIRHRVASFCHGVLANQSEHTWHTFEPWRGRVAPVLHSWLAGAVQVYPRCQPAPVGAPLFVLDPDPGDGAEQGKHENYGVLNGVLVRVDYAMHP